MATRSASKLGKRNPMWKGDEVQYSALHIWVRTHLPKTDYCQVCGIKPPLDLANISSSFNEVTYTRDFKNWQWLCRRCHMIQDGRIDKMYRGGRPRLYNSCTACERKHEAKGYCTKHYQQFRTKGYVNDN